MDALPEPTNPWLALLLSANDVESITSDAIIRRLRTIREIDFCPAQFFAAILEAEGLTTTTAYPGQSNDRDIIARDGPLGTGPNRWFCRVMDAEVTTGEAEVRQFLADLPAGHKGMLASISLVDNDARKAAKDHDVRLVSDGEFMALFVRHYPSFNDDLKEAVPLRSVFAPVWEQRS